ncbi:MAG: trans-sulfuration enzyme family protein, partial [Ilumatobacteraceae bacterium]
MPEQQPETTAITAGRDDSGSLAPALWPSTTWQSSGLDESSRHAVATHSVGNYARYANPTVRAFEHAIAELEGAEDALAFGSGMGAVSSVILALCSSGDHIVAQRQIYGGTVSFLNGPCQRLGIDVTYVDGTKPGAFIEAIRPGKTMLVLAESPSNPLMEVVDFTELGSIKGPFTVVDSTMATPLGQRPLEYGVSLVLHSATKGIAGHNDATLGVIAGKKELIDAIWGYSVLHGATASPHDALNGLRGVRTLGVRFAHQCASAQRIAELLGKHPAVSAVFYPGLDTFSQHELAKRQMRMFGSVLAFEVHGGTDAARRVMDRVRLVRPAVSFGGPETLICHPATSTHVGVDSDAQNQAGITAGLMRFSVGLEATSDIIADLEQA